MKEAREGRWESRRRNFLISLWLGIWLMLTGGLAVAAGEQTYTDRQYGYTFQYAADYILDAPGTGGWATLLKENRRVITVTMESLNETAKTELKQSRDLWQDFIVERAKVSCMADGPDGSVYCDGVVQQRTWRTASGLRVIELHLRLVDERFGPPPERHVSTVGPIYGVDLSRPGYVFGLLVGSGHEFPRTPEDKELARKIVENVQLIPDAEFQPPQPIRVGPGPAFQEAPGKAVIPLPAR